MSQSEIQRHNQRIPAMVGRGKVQLVDDTGPVQVMQIVLSPRETRDLCYRSAEYGHASSPLPGANAVMVFIGGDRSNGAVIATDDPRYRPHLQPGESAIHDNQKQMVHIANGAIIITTDATGNPIQLVTFGNVQITATGNATISAGGSATISAGGNCVIETGGTVQLGAAGGRKVVLDGDPVSTGGTVSATSTKVTGT